MRLTDIERCTLVQTITAADPQAQIWLHGSRARDDAKGGDIDLLVLSQRLGLREKLAVLAQLHSALGERKIDITIACDEQKPFTRLAIAQGVRLSTLVPTNLCFYAPKLGACAWPVST